MKFWDTSAVVPLLVEEPATAAMQNFADRNPKGIIWWATPAECASALTRKMREGALASEAAEFGFERLRQIVSDWHEVEPSQSLRETAVRFLRVHPLRAAEALQLAAAFMAAEGVASSLEVVSLDDRLSDAARKEGFLVVPSASGG